MSEAKVIARLKELEKTVLIPFGDNSRYDLVYEDDSSFKRVQVKTGWIDNGTVKFKCHNNQSNTNKNRSKTYTKEDIDEFAVYCCETEEVYLVPVEESGKYTMQLRLQEPEQYSSKRINWAEDYLLR